MIGDKLVIKEYHAKIADKIFNEIKDELLNILSNGKKYVISVAGESGAGKSEIGHEINKLLSKNNINSQILSQDDYFVFPPKTNHRMRLNNLEQVGLYEVKLDLIDANLFDFNNNVKEIYKPLVNYNEDSISYEIIDVSNCKVIIAEGTYTTALKYVDKRIFIDRTYKETKKNRIERGRDKNDDFVEQVLEIEHRIIRKHKEKSEIVINSDFSNILVYREALEK